MRSPRILVALSLLPWPLVGWALYGLHNYWVALLAYHAFCLGTYAWMGSGRVRLDRSLLLYLAAALLFLLPALPVVGFFVDPERVRTVMGGFGFAPAHLPLFIAYFLLVHPFAEEAFWRGTIYDGLLPSLGAPGAAVLSSCFFGAWHALVLAPLLPSWWWLGVLGVSFFGLFMAAVYHRNRFQLMHCTVFHAVGGDLPLLLILGSVVLAP
ncbi:MAG: CPBP family intramembrane glutamic endopeptidase [Candidatus Eremiobacterota bacterium]